ncbi:MAG TPA: DinB family protein [Bryobacteraceae bacterium]|nr:DinB family protein [Bryobacteraceae bacterium]
MQPEPWLRGSLSGVHPAIAPLIRSFEMAREDLERFTEGLSAEQMWKAPDGVNPAGREIRHIAGSLDRLITYLEGRQLDEHQIAAIDQESKPGASRDELLREMTDAFARAEALLRSLDPDKLMEPREVGRKRLPTTAIGLIVHMAEHTQRHVGQAIVAAKLARKMRSTVPQT